MESLQILKNAKELLSPIPTEDWLVGKFTDGVGKCCAVGHYTRLTSDNPDDYSEKNCDDYHSGEFREASCEGSKCMGTGIWEDSVANVNNGNTTRYLQKSTKDRVMTYLDDAINCLSKNSD